MPPLRQLAAHYHDRATARSALAEIENLVADPDNLRSADMTPPATASKPAARLAIEGLTVKTATGATILDGLDLDLAPGKTLAIMGPSGIGKSTLARAIARLTPFEGTITLDDRPLSEWPEPELRGALALIAQKPRIFTGTIAENIGFADPLADRASITSAADRALATQFTASLPDGLDTLVGEGGYGLSGGQIQRIGLARLFLTAPALIILDEPTAHLDPETEAQLLDQVFAFAEGRTLIILTHSATVAARADAVLRMAGGKLLPTPHRARPATAKREDRA